ncbi:MAG TPA: hypothetical protein VLT85_09210 [Terriglobales bacterium]|nr:hypothetical protein [Terriglobales bacterium]HXZ29010.1 hypothetical protein [Terriglobales bacterium]
MAKQKKPTHDDAAVVMKLYNLRRETELRKARNFLVVEFWPDAADEVVKLIQDFGSQRNAWFRQGITYWDMACSLVLRGVVNQDLFVDWGGELYFLYAKFKPFLQEVREKTQAPEFMARIEQVALSTKEGRERVAKLEKRIAQRRQMLKQAAAGRG